MLKFLLLRLLPLASIATAGASATDEGQIYADEVVDTVKVIVTTIDMTSIAEKISLESTMDREMPTEANFTDWIEKNVRAKGKSPAMDYFGNYFRLKRASDFYYVVSDGPDQEAYTADDIEVAAEVAFNVDRAYKR